MNPATFVVETIPATFVVGTSPTTFVDIWPWNIPQVAQKKALNKEYGNFKSDCVTKFIIRINSSQKSKIEM